MKEPQDTKNIVSTSRYAQKYQKQVEKIIDKHGDLEAIRARLDLSQRQMCQLLFVDPSAWSRWLKSGGPPAHIYRSLEWYLALNDKFPALDVDFWLNTRLKIPDNLPEKLINTSSVEKSEVPQKFLAEGEYDQYFSILLSEIKILKETVRVSSKDWEIEKKVTLILKILFWISGVILLTAITGILYFILAH